MQAKKRPIHAMVLALVFSTLPLMIPAARAETTAWVDNEGGRMRVIALPPEADGTVRALLQIEPKPGWITYWREPGESGIPPQVSVSGGAALQGLAYPVPKVLSLGNLRDIGYDSAVSLPVMLEKASGPATLDAFIGICNRICIPFQAQFALGLTGSPALPGEEAAIGAATALLPQQPSADLAVTAASITGETMTLDVTVPPGTTATEAIVTGPPGYVFSARGRKPSGNRAVIAVSLTGLPAKPAPAAIQWQALIKAGNRAIEMPVTPE